MKEKIGIVIVSYNASPAVRSTLASLRRAKNEVASEVILVDNASRDDERPRLRGALERHASEAGLPWRYLQEPRNLGFSGGNNVGIRAFLEDPAVTHVCLLNSDVIVSDRWLDRLVAAGKDIVSAVTNKADSEQCVPVDYAIGLDRCLDEPNESLAAGVFETVDDFSQRWHRAWRGNLLDCDATFFCVLLSRRAIERIGLLDETFFPGGFEDDDYCARARAAGIPVHLARDVFIHHWGSASFGQLRYEYFSENAARNKRYLEQKHGFTWKRRPEKPFVSFAQDVAHALAGGGDRSLQPGFVALYTESLDRLLAHHRDEFARMSAAIARSGVAPAEDLAREIAAVEGHAELGSLWRSVLDDVGAGLASAPCPPALRESVGRRMDALADGVHRLASCNLAMHAHLSAQPQAPAALTGRPPGRLRKALWLLRNGLPFLLKLRGIVFFGGYPYPERENDGYFQRIRAIDRLFDDRWRIYVDSHPLEGQNLWFDLPAPRTLVLRMTGGRKRRLFVKALVMLCALRCRAIYFHSVLRMEESRFGRLMRWPGIRKVIDVHGVVPEEFRLYNDFYSAVLFEAHERLAVRKADCVIVVTEAMNRYLRQKYRDAFRGEAIALPIFPGLAPFREARPYVDGKPVVVYAGGLHKWQQVPKMVDAIGRTYRSCLHRFYCPDPAAVLRMIPDAARDSGSVTVESKSHEELLRRYAECHYGFILRDDIVVNHVACPTKLIEYLAMGIVPIVDCEDIGDFRELGMRFVRLADFVAGRIPDEATRAGMASENFDVYERLRAQRESGAARLRQVLADGAGLGRARAAAAGLARSLLPAGTIRGRAARRLWRTLRGAPGARPAPAAETAAASPTELAPCDVLVQVGNFTGGGLENVVLDLNLALRDAGHRVSLLVLGEAGAAVEAARAQGVPVCVASYSDAAYRHWLRTAAPRLVMSHYSTEGAAACGESRIPLVQVIHNVYMWLDDAQRADFARAAEHTACFVAVSDFARRYSVQRLGMPDEKCVVIPNGIDTGQFAASGASSDRERLRAALGLGSTDFVFLSVGSVNHQKNHLSTVRAFRACLRECPDARLVVLGPVHEKALLDEMTAYLASNGISDRVFFPGGVARPAEYYSMADAFVHSAFFEGGPLALLEAIAANLPVVAVETGLAGHFRGLRGIHLVPPHLDVFAYRGHITQMRASPETESMTAAAMVRVWRERQRPDLPEDVIESFDRRNAYRMYIELVDAFLAGRETPGASVRQGWPVRLAEYRE
ncbi:glycosyltransferase [Burkholderiaceae bacterium FT117]|uniref:glycosyltransferase n=1 Tax=Zeimonas sediminis TaxID=2944268 RepID=UPI002342F1ED|nr:glycosyltransferase [Zeimonas sediminis]MCM5572373.1 glycosyltransferase [Zeimonas sediminis]